MESLIATIVIVLLTVLANWAQKKNQPDQTTGEQKPPHLPRAPRPVTPRPTHPPAAPKPRPSVPRFDWEEELRRLLRGEIEEPREPAQPPPVVRAERPQPPPPPPPPQRVQQPRPHGEPPAVPVVRTRIGESGEGTGSQGERGQVSTAYDRARQLHEDTAQRLKDVSDRTKRHAVHIDKGQHALSPEELAETLNLIRSLSGVRKALVASVILGPPKALE